MPIWLQHLLVVLLAIGCCAIIGWQGFKTLTLRGRGKLGACCAKGCDAGEKLAATGKSPAERIQFLPVEMLSRKR